MIVTVAPYRYFEDAECGAIQYIDHGGKKEYRGVVRFDLHDTKGYCLTFENLQTAQAQLGKDWHGTDVCIGTPAILSIVPE